MLSCDPISAFCVLIGQQLLLLSSTSRSHSATRSRSGGIVGIADGTLTLDATRGAGQARAIMQRNHSWVDSRLLPSTVRAVSPHLSWV
jgi:hypothetical protein